MSQRYQSRKGKTKNKTNQWIPILLALAGLGLVVFGVLALRNNGSGSKAGIEVTGAPSLKVDKEQVDLGDVKLGQTVQVGFKLTNVGDQALRFSEKPYIELVEGC